MPQHCCVISVSSLLREMILRVVADDEEAVEASKRTQTLSAALLAELEMAPREAILLPMPAERRARKVAELMLKDPADRRSLADWGQTVGASPRTLARHFERDTGVSFGRWRQQLDVALAIQKLCSGESVQQVAGALGYETASSFIAMFRRAMGDTPARYLKSISRQPDNDGRLGTEPSASDAIGNMDDAG
jgi:AraC-like DNA-binding protein